MAVVVVAADVAACNIVEDNLVRRLVACIVEHKASLAVEPLAEEEVRSSSEMDMLGVRRVWDKTLDSPLDNLQFFVPFVQYYP